MRLQSVEIILEALAAAAVRYLIAGGLAVNAHGYLRFTKDVDLVIELEPDNLRAALEALGRLGYRPAVPVPLAQLADRGPVRQPESEVDEAGQLPYLALPQRRVHTEVGACGSQIPPSSTGMGLFRRSPRRAPRRSGPCCQVLNTASSIGAPPLEPSSGSEGSGVVSGGGSVVGRVGAGVPRGRDPRGEQPARHPDGLGERETDPRGAAR